jgi:hypothetical protein
VIPLKVTKVRVSNRPRCYVDPSNSVNWWKKLWAWEISGMVDGQKQMICECLDKETQWIASLIDSARDRQVKQ